VWLDRRLRSRRLRGKRDHLLRWTLDCEKGSASAGSACISPGCGGTAKSELPVLSPEIIEDLEESAVSSATCDSGVDACCAWHGSTDKRLASLSRGAVDEQLDTADADDDPGHALDVLDAVVAAVVYMGGGGMVDAANIRCLAAFKRSISAMPKQSQGPNNLAYQC